MSSFSATIMIINGNPYVRPPEPALTEIFGQAGRNRSPIPIRGTVNGAPFRQSLVRYLGDWRLYINGVMAKAAGLTYAGSIAAIVGTPVTVSFGYDPSPPVYAMVPSLRTSLHRNANASAAFDLLTPGRKKEILRYLRSLKTDASVARNVARIIEHLQGKQSDALYPLMHRKRSGT